MTNKELRKLRVIEQVIEKKMKQKKAGMLLGLSVRQIIQLAKRVRREGANLHRPAPRDKEFKQILSIQKRHPLRNDNTIRHEKKIYQILGEWKGSKPEWIVAQERMDDKLYIMEGQRELKYREISEPPKREPETKKKALRAPCPPKPSMDNPLKAKSFQRYLKRQAARDAKRQLQTTGCRD